MNIAKPPGRQSLAVWSLLVSPGLSWSRCSLLCPNFHLPPVLVSRDPLSSPSEYKHVLIYTSHVINKDHNRD